MEIKTAIAKLYANRATELSQMGKQNAAIELYRQIIQVEPKNYDCYYRLALLLIQMGKQESAKISLQQGLEIHPEQADVHHQLGKIFQQRQQFKQAIAHYYQAVELDPQNASYHFALGKCLYNSDQPQEAEQSFQRVITIDYKFFWAYYFLGLLKRRQRDKKGALRYFCRAIQLEPQQQHGHLVFQYLAVDNSQLSELIEFYRQIIADNSTCSSIAWGNLGDLLSQQGQTEAAINCYRTNCYQQATTKNSHLTDLDWQSKKNPPDFIVVGAGKCGTTSLWQYLSCHPQVLVPHKKELNFFTSEQYGLGWEWYLSHFPAITDYEDLVTGEASPSYFNNPYALTHIPKLGKTKIIILLRHPVNRLLSWYHHSLRDGQERRSLSQIVKLEIESFQSDLLITKAAETSYLANSIYLHPVQKWLDAMPKDQVLIIQTEELAVNPNKTMRQTFDFLQLPHYQPIDYIQHNQGHYDFSHDHQLIKTLTDFFQPYNQQLEKLLNRKFNW